MRSAGTRQTAGERREAVLVAALEAFARGGLDGTSTEDIADAAGISQPYLFRLFGTKKKLFVATVERCMADTLELFRAAAGDLRGEEALDAMGDAYVAMLLGDRALALHRTRDLLVRQRTQLINMIRELMAEFGIHIPKGITNALAFVRRAVAGEANEVPDLATKVIAALAEQAIDVQCRIRQLERDLLALFRSNDLARRIATVPGVGLLGATAIAATVTDPTQFRSGRQFAAWLGLTPLNNSSGGKERLGQISKMGDQYLRRLLVTGMTSLVRRNKHHLDAADPRINALLARKPVRLVTVAMANRAARVIWAIMLRGEVYRRPAAGMAA